MANGHLLIPSALIHIQFNQPMQTLSNNRDSNGDRFTIQCGEILPLEDKDEDGEVSFPAEM